VCSSIARAQTSDVLRGHVVDREGHGLAEVEVIVTTSAGRPDVLQPIVTRASVLVPSRHGPPMLGATRLDASGGNDFVLDPSDLASLIAMLPPRNVDVRGDFARRASSSVAQVGEFASNDNCLLCASLSFYVSGPLRDDNLTCLAAVDINRRSWDAVSLLTPRDAELSALGIARDSISAMTDAHALRTPCSRIAWRQP